MSGKLQRSLFMTDVLCQFLFLQQCGTESLLNLMTFIEAATVHALYPFMLHVSMPLLRRTQSQLRQL